MNQICQICNEPGGDIVVRNSKLIPNQKLFVMKTCYDAGMEPFWIVLIYGHDLINKARADKVGPFTYVSQDNNFCKIIEKKLYHGPEITMRQLLGKSN